MLEVILQLLEKLRQKHDIRLLGVWESGSRMWGFHSDIPGDLDKSSDYDVRGVFCYSSDTYLGIKPYQEQIEHYEYTENGTMYMDIVLWDIRKFAKLAMNSNPSVYEWLQSPIMYYQDMQFVTKFKEIFMQGLCKNALAIHYLGMMMKNFNKYTNRDDGVPYKKYLYMLRAVACFKCLQQGQLPEMHYQEVIKHLEPKYQEIMLLAVEKKKSGEQAKGPAIPEVFELYQELVEFKKGKNLKIKKFNKVDELNQLVVDVISGKF